MADTVIFNSPLLLVLYGIALALALIELVTKLTGYVLPLCSLGIFIGATIYGLLLGASLWEVAIFVLAFFLVYLLTLRRKRT